MTACDHNGYDDPERVGRANYRCRKCGRDISIEVILIAAAYDRQCSSCGGFCAGKCKRENVKVTK